MSVAVSHRPRPRDRSRILAALVSLVSLLFAGAAFAVVPAGPAHAAVPDRWGFGYRAPADPIGAPLNLSTSSVGAPGIVVGLVGPNQYVVRFPGLGGPGGVVHVTAVSNPPNVPSWCIADRWIQAGADEMVYVSCWVQGPGVANPFQTGFSVDYTASSGPPVPGNYAYLESNGAAGIITSYNSSGAVIPPPAPGPPGQWLVILPGVGGAPPATGSIQVTAVRTGMTMNPPRCKVSNWATTAGAENIQVRCVDGTGAPINTPWTLTYQGQRTLTGRVPVNFGYLLTAGGAPATTNYNSVIAGPVNSAVAIPPASYRVLFPGIAVAPDNVQVTAFGPVTDFCRIGIPAAPPWYNNAGTATVRSVDCFNGAGAPVVSTFFTSYESRV